MSLSHFAHPLWLILLAAPLALVIGYLIAQRRRHKHMMRFANMEMLESVAPNRPGRLRHVPIALLLAGLVLLTLALAGPTRNERVPRNRATVILVIDVSLSMKATDVQPNRLVAAQQAAKNFSDGLNSGINLGLVTFAGTASVLVSPTLNRSEIKAAIDHLQLSERTSTGEGIYTALQSIETLNTVLGGAGQPPPAQIVMESDGKQTVPRDDDVSNPRHAFVAARESKQKGVPISTISFGTEWGEVEDPSPDGGGKVIPVPVGNDFLKEVARLSGGKFFTATSFKQLDDAYTDLKERIGYEIKRGDASRPLMILSAVALIAGLGTALVLRQRLP